MSAVLAILGTNAKWSDVIDAIWEVVVPGHLFATA